MQYPACARFCMVEHYGNISVVVAVQANAVVAILKGYVGHIYTDAVVFVL